MMERLTARLQMNADEVVSALRCCNRSKGHRCSECPVFSRYEHGICKATVDRFAADLIESLQAQLAESQRRELAAVEFIKYLDRNYSGYMAEDEGLLTANDKTFRRDMLSQELNYRLF